VINELAVMPLPLPPSEADAERNEGQPAENAQLRKPTDDERRYASELITRLLDTGIMRRIGAAKRRMAQLPDGAEKIDLLGQITKLETLRKDLQSRVFGNNVA
ncbi:MAG TPA: DNA primase, partial [Bifidobacterium sp.]|nr:DNA primase [Bifidobacterium sp.]